MAIRITRVYTRTGDKGETGLVGGKRVPKDATRIEAYGTVDELNAAIGFARAACRDRELDALLSRVQAELFEVGADLADPAAGGDRAERPARITADHVARLEGEIDRFSGEVPPLRRFILPGGGELGARLHLARTVARRAERRAVTLAAREPVNPEVIRYLNRLSDWLFVAARLANHREGAGETEWDPRGG